MSATSEGSVPPPGWREGDAAASFVPVMTPPAVATQPVTSAQPVPSTPPLASARPGVSAQPLPSTQRVPSFTDPDSALWPASVYARSVAASAQPAAEAAVRWRIRAAWVDNLIVDVLYLVICLILNWQVTSVSHLVVFLLLGVVYHYLLESHGGQTIGKRIYGIQVVHVNGGPATPRGIALRSILRAIDELPFNYLSGLISMIRTGPERRQRIGDIVGETKVVAVGGRALNRGTPEWMLPTAAIVALVFSIFTIYVVAETGGKTLTNPQQLTFLSPKG